jgi:hypothetical protein
MSQDFKIQNICDHKIIREEALLSFNRKDITVGLPIVSTNDISLYISGNLVPKENYTIQNLETAQDEYPRRVLRMRKRIKVAFPIVEVSYVTVAERCPKCLGVRVIDDYKLSHEGDIALVKDEAYLVQQVEKYIVTRLGSNKFHSWMGTTLQSLIGTKVTDIDLLRSRITDQVNSAISKLVDVQSQLIASGRKLTLGEIYGTTQSLVVQPTDDPTMFEVILSFTARSGKTIEYSQFLELDQFRKRLNV